MPFSAILFCQVRWVFGEARGATCLPDISNLNPSPSEVVVEVERRPQKTTQSLVYIKGHGGRAGASDCHQDCTLPNAWTGSPLCLRNRGNPPLITSPDF